MRGPKIVFISYKRLQNRVKLEADEDLKLEIIQFSSKLVELLKIIQRPRFKRRKERN